MKNISWYFLVFILGIWAGYGWRMAQVEPSMRIDVATLQHEMKSVKMDLMSTELRLLHVEGKRGYPGYRVKKSR